MIEILPNIFVIEVPKDAVNVRLSFLHEALIYYLDGKDNYIKLSNFYDHTLEKLGTITPTEIDFDCEPLVEQVLIRYEVPTRVSGFLDVYEYKNYIEDNQYGNSFDSAELSFRSALTASGITDYENLAVIRRQ